MSAQQYLPDMADPADLAEPNVVRELADRFGYDERRVASWPRVKARAELQECRRKESALTNKAAAAAGEEPHPPGPRLPSLRRDAAAALGHALRHPGHGCDLLYAAVAGAVWEMYEGELRRFAENLIKRYTEAGE